MTRSAIGRLIKKTARQETCSISQPPITGPIPAVIALKHDQVPMPRPRSFHEKEQMMMERLPGTRSAEQNTSSARAATSWQQSPANPHAAQAAANSEPPIKKK